LVQGGSLVIGTLPRPRYWYMLGLFISTKKWPRPGPRYQNSVRITSYVQINFSTNINSECFYIMLWLGSDCIGFHRPVWNNVSIYKTKLNGKSMNKWYVALSLKLKIVRWPLGFFHLWSIGVNIDWHGKLWIARKKQ